MKKIKLIVALIALTMTVSVPLAHSKATQEKATGTKQAVEKTDAEKVDELRVRQREQWTKYYIQKIKDYSFNFESDSATPLKLLPDSKLHYLNTVRGRETHGEMFIWTANGKCVLAGSILSYDMAENSRRVAHEFHSFSEKKIEGGHSQFPVDMEAPGVKFVEIAGAPAVPKARALRLVQLRRLAKSFEATTLAGGDVVRPLRALNQPIYRYETKEIDDDGAVFAYVTGTDPELLVAIESRPTKDGPKWHFAAARFTDLPITLKYKKVSVWEFNEQSNYAGGYSCTHGIDLQPSMPVVEEETQTETTKEALK